MSSAFVTPLNVELVDSDAASGRGLWRLLTPLVYQSDIAKRTFTVPEGFITDFASVPRVPVAFLLVGDTGNEASVVHDWLYATGAVPRGMADLVLKEACIATGMPSWRAWLIYIGVRAGGSSRYKTGIKKV